MKIQLRGSGLAILVGWISLLLPGLFLLPPVGVKILVGQGWGVGSVSCVSVRESVVASFMDLEVMAGVGSIDFQDSWVIL